MDLLLSGFLFFFSRILNLSLLYQTSIIQVLTIACHTQYLSLTLYCSDVNLLIDGWLDCALWVAVNRLRYYDRFRTSSLSDIITVLLNVESQRRGIQTVNTTYRTVITSATSVELDSW